MACSDMIRDTIACEVYDRFWYLLDVPPASENVCFSGKTGNDRCAVEMTLRTRNRHLRPCRTRLQPSVAGGSGPPSFFTRR
jgi:hypothetical protein